MYQSLPLFSTCQSGHQTSTLSLTHFVGITRSICYRLFSDNLGRKATQHVGRRRGIHHTGQAHAPTPGAGVTSYRLLRMGRDTVGCYESRLLLLLLLLLMMMLLMMHVLLHVLPPPPPLLLLLLLRDVRHAVQARAPTPDAGVTSCRLLRVERETSVGCCGCCCCC